MAAKKKQSKERNSQENDLEEVAIIADVITDPSLLTTPPPPPPRTSEPSHTPPSHVLVDRLPELFHKGARFVESSSFPFSILLQRHLANRDV